MAIDLIAAAKRRRNGDYSVASNGVYQHELDTNALADAYAAELDDTPLTVKLLTSMGYAASVSNPDWLERGKESIAEDADRWLYIHGDQEIGCRTLGDLKTAMRLSGIEVTHEG
jgi:hypothetical protein